MERWNTGIADKKWNIGVMEFWNIGFRTEKKFLPSLPLFQFSSVPKCLLHYSILPTFHYSKRMGAHTRRAKVSLRPSYPEDNPVIFYLSHPRNRHRPHLPGPFAADLLGHLLQDLLQLLLFEKPLRTSPLPIYVRSV
jgi:hypothetical protein